jgi:hypothetical protein
MNSERSLGGAGSRRSSAVEKLSDYDDICTDLLVDKVCFWGETHKMSKHYKTKRRVSEREVLAVIRALIRGQTTAAEAAEALLQYHTWKLG